ncbi:MAG TPA: hypothetical protein VFT66_15465 [Roseiflexaceae bacterium]|nr:hypothetical protein [Roseiflexaceae bacterium]
MPPDTFTIQQDGTTVYAANAAYVASHGTDGLRTCCYINREAAWRAVARQEVYTPDQYAALTTVQHGRTRQ